MWVRGCVGIKVCRYVCKKVDFFGQVMPPYHSDQISQRSPGSLCSVVETLIVGNERLKTK